MTWGRGGAAGTRLLVLARLCLRLAPANGCRVFQRNRLIFSIFIARFFVNHQFSLRKRLVS